MDNVAMILFGCVIATITGLNFMELHKIRKNLERRERRAQDHNSSVPEPVKRPL
ncbi:MAG TPA: hypothetical protein VEK33_07835 [Terriglobales bacterium]|nr:hypothetical protein [Terriglobales bacterium]